MTEKDQMTEEFLKLVRKLGHVPTTREYKDLKKESLDGPAFKAIKRVFGSWNGMLEEAGLPIHRRVDWSKVSDKKVLRCILVFTAEYGRPPTIADFDKRLVGIDYETLTSRFGNLPNALAKLNLKIKYGEGANYARIVEELKVLAAKLGRTPTRDEFESVYGVTVYRGVYSWSDIVKMAGLRPTRRYKTVKPRT